MRGVRAAIFVCGALAASPLSAGMSDTEGLAPYEVCALCHSLDGVSRMAKFPKLAGQPSLYLQKQVKDFLDGHRTNDGGQMAAIVTEIVPEDIPIAADWFASQPAPEPETQDENHETGLALFEQLECATCHAGGNEQSPLLPYLRSQHAAYLAKQMTDFRDGDRQNDLGQQMQKKMSALSDDDIAAIASYLAATPREAQ